jgi:hypothetical protein
LLCVITGKEPKENIQDKLTQDGFYKDKKLTEKGNSELRRLATIAGLISDTVFDDIRARKEFNDLIEVKK